MFEKIKNMWGHKKNVPIIEDVDKELDDILKINFNEFTSEDWYTYINCDILRNKLLEYLRTYNNIYEIYVNIDIKIRKYIYNGNYIDVYITCDWENGPLKSKINDGVKIIINKHLHLPKTIDNFKFNYELTCHRNYTDETILKHAKKYAKCINKCLPLNMVTIKIMEYNGVSVYSMVIRELDMVEDIDSYSNNGEEK